MAPATDRPRTRLRERVAEKKVSGHEALPIISEIFSGMGEAAERARARKAEAAAIRSQQHLHSMAEGPSTEVLKSDPVALSQAIRRHQVKRIADVANPLSPDTDQVFTSGGARYAKTGVYVPTVRERAEGVKRAARERTEAFWDRNKKTIVVGSIAALGVLLLYNSWKTQRLRERLEAERAHRHHVGFYSYNPEEEMESW